MPRTVALRGYTKRLGPDRYVAVCITLNLVTVGTSAQDALSQLDDLETAYLKDAVERDEWDAFVPRRSPLSFYIEYVLARLLRMFRGMGDFGVFKVEKAPARRTPAHA